MERRFVGRRGLVRRLEALADLDRPGRSRYGAGEARFELAESTLVVRPPFGLAELGELDGIVVAPLVEELERDRVVGAVLVRLGGWSVGVLDGERVVASRTGGRLVHGRHRAGGSSANRFRRRRENEARALVEQAADAAAAVVLPHAARLDAVALGGDRDAIRRTLAARRELEPLAAKALPRFFTVPDPRRRVLDELPYDLYAAEVEET